MKPFSAYSLRARIILLGLILVAPLVLLFIVLFENNAGQGVLTILAVIVLAYIGAALLAARRLIFDPLQKLGDAAAAIGDITALLRQREQELKISGDRYRMLADATEAMQDGVAIYDAEDRLVLFNEAWRRHREGGQEVFTVGRRYADIIAVYCAGLCDGKEDFQDNVKIELERHGRGDGYPWEAQDRDGRWYLTRHFRMRDGGILTASTDITALKKAEAVRAEEMLIDAIEAMQDSVALYDSDEQLILANRALMARTPHFLELLDEGTRFEDVLRGFWEAEREVSDDGQFEAFIQSRLEHFRRADGSPLETETAEGGWCESRHFRTRDGGTINVNADITAAKRAAAEVEAARDAAEAANQAKSAFLASMSHEIRTPMNGVLGFTDLLLDTDLSAIQRRHLRGIQEAGKSLLSLINDILDLSKIEAGKLEFERVPISPTAIADGTASILRSQFAAKAIDLRVKHAPDVPMWVEGDPTRVRQILLNLISNALKFTDRGRVTVRSSLQHGDGGDMLRFEVMDTGIGIPADRQHLLFQDFSQVDRSTTRRFGGTGLGLAICKRLVEAMGGEIGVTSVPGAGSTFWFTVPGHETASPESLNPVWLETESLPAKILVAEDLPMNQLVIDGYLRGAGHDVVFAANGVEAVAVIESERFDLVLMDMEMPEMDGIAATRAIRASNGPMRDVPIVALTANALLEDAALCRAAGMNDFLSKPIDRPALNAMIAKWARRDGRRNGELASARGRAQILDPGIVDEIEKLLGKEKTAKFVEMSRTALAAMIPTFVAWDDADAVARDAHKLISIAGNIGCMELVQLSRELLAAMRETQHLGTLRNTLVAALERAMAALQLRFPVETMDPLAAAW